jgi:hypothetical protein
MKSIPPPIKLLCEACEAKIKEQKIFKEEGKKN